MSKDFNYEIKKHIATLSTSENSDYTTELNLISYNGASPKYDIRKWDRKSDRMLKGITLTDEEARQLKEALATAI
jgi:hypothetical protein